MHIFGCLSLVYSLKALSQKALKFVLTDLTSSGSVLLACSFCRQWKVRLSLVLVRSLRFPCVVLRHTRDQQQCIQHLKMNQQQIMFTKHHCRVTTNQIVRIPLNKLSSNADDNNNNNVYKPSHKSTRVQKNTALVSSSSARPSLDKLQYYLGKKIFQFLCKKKQTISLKFEVYLNKMYKGLWPRIQKYSQRKT